MASVIKSKKITGGLEGWGAWIMALVGLGLMIFGFHNILLSSDQENQTRQLISDTRAGAAIVASQANVVALGNNNWSALEDASKQVKAGYELIGKGGRISGEGGVTLSPLQGSSRANWSQAGQSLSVLQANIKSMQEEELITNQGFKVSKTWLDSLRGVAGSIEQMQSQSIFRQEPWASILLQQRQLLERLPQNTLNLSKDDVAAILQNSASAQSWSKTIDPTYKPAVDALLKNWSVLSESAQSIQARNQSLLRLQGLQPKILASAVKFQKDLINLSNRLAVSMFWLRWIWVGLGLVISMVSVSLMLYFAQSWVQQAIRGRSQARRYERLELAVSDLTRQMDGLFIGEALRINGKIDPLEDRNPILMPLVEGVNRIVHVIAKIMSSADQRLGEIDASTKEADEHVGPLLGFAHDYNELMQNLEQKVNRFQGEVESAQMSWKDIQTQNQSANQKGHEGQEVVQASQATTDAVRQALQDAAKRIKRMGESTQNIIQNTSIIRNLTREMHVLSTNAAIEVAAVGDKGRKFGVVAKEIQRLSKNTNETISEIEGWVQKVQEDAQGAISSMEESTGGVARSAHHNEQAGETLRELQGMLGATEALSQTLSLSLNGLFKESRNWQGQLESAGVKSEEVHHHVLSTSASLEKSQQALHQIKKSTSTLSTQG